MIKYPNNINKSRTYNKPKIYGNRGMTLEAFINDTNRYYLEKNIANIHKKPTPIQVVEQKNGIITKAYFKSPSTTDYNGIYKGKYIDFEAKETTSKTSFPLANIHAHQINHIKNILTHGGISFLIIRFTLLNKTYLLFAQDFIKYIESNNKKSIPINFFKEHAFLMKDKLNPKVDYIEVINKYGGISYENEKSEIKKSKH